MGDYRRMGSMEQHLGNETSITMLHQLRDLWRSPRGTVLRIEALALVAIVLSFFLATFGSCRRWSNRWIVQKGFLAAQVLSLSLGTYSIGLMQSSSVKSEMYPIWAVSLLTLFGCVDPITSYIGLDYKGTFLKVVFQLCLYCGYVLLVSVPTTSGVVGNLAIGVLISITFIKSFHRSLALVLPSRIRDQLGGLAPAEPDALVGDGEGLMVHLPIRRIARTGAKIRLWQYETIMTWVSKTTMTHIRWSCNHMVGEPWLGITPNDKEVIEDACLGCSLSLLLRRRFLGLDTAREMDEKRRKFESLIHASRGIDYKRTMKAIEIELAFLYEVLFTSNEFLHYHEARTSSFWAFASFICICFVGVSATIRGTMDGPDRGRHRMTSTAASDDTAVFVVDTTKADLIITGVILMSLALVQLAQLVRCWASNWARVTFACEYAATQPIKTRSVTMNTTGPSSFMGFGPRTTVISDPEISSWWPWMRLKALVITKMNWFDKYLWQDKLGQYSVLDSKMRKSRMPFMERHCECCYALCFFLGCICCCDRSSRPGCYINLCHRLPQMLGLHYVRQVLKELWGSDTKAGAAVRLHDDVKTCIVEFLGQIKSRRIGKEWSQWTSVFADSGLAEDLLQHLPYKNAPLQVDGTTMSDAYAFTHRVMLWHIATCYCEQGASSAGGKEDSDEREKNRRVAIDLSKYCAYLVVSAPELLPGPSAETKRAFDQADTLMKYSRNTINSQTWDEDDGRANASNMGQCLGMLLQDEAVSSGGPWKALALLWVQTLLYAAPYGDVQRHMQHLSEGGEFITHLWALLYHIGIDRRDEGRSRRN